MAKYYGRNPSPRLKESTTYVKDGINQGKSYKEYLEEAGIKIVDIDSMFSRSKLRLNSGIRRKKNV
jgi:hypothetical protein